MENNTEEKIEVKTVDSSEDIVITPQEKEAYTKLVGIQKLNQQYRFHKLEVY